ncbi:hypothetical protein V8E54_015150 [Elaphomyces granulatus]
MFIYLQGLKSNKHAIFDESNQIEQAKLLFDSIRLDLASNRDVRRIDNDNHAQLFFLDPQFATDSRHGQNSTLNSRLLRKLDDLLRENNRFYRVYLTAKGRLEAALS